MEERGRIGPAMGFVSAKSKDGDGGRVGDAHNGGAARRQRKRRHARAVCVSGWSDEAARHIGILHDAARHRPVGVGVDYVEQRCGRECRHVVHGSPCPPRRVEVEVVLAAGLARRRRLGCWCCGASNSRSSAASWRARRREVPVGGACLARQQRVAAAPCYVAGFSGREADQCSKGRMALPCTLPLHASSSVAIPDRRRRRWSSISARPTGCRTSI